MTDEQKTAYINSVRTAATALTESLEKGQNLQTKWVALDLGNVLQDSDFTGTNLGMTMVDLSNYFNTLDAIVGPAGLGAGHKTNMYKAGR